MNETTETLEHEAALARDLGKQWECRVVKMRQFYPVDYALMMPLDKDRVGALAELKCRTCQHDTYDTYMISLRKVVEIRALCAEQRLGGFIVVRFTDGDYYWSLRSPRKANDPAGRHVGVFDRQRDVPPKGPGSVRYEMEPVLHIPMAEFNLL